MCIYLLWDIIQDKCGVLFGLVEQRRALCVETILKTNPPQMMGVLFVEEELLSKAVKNENEVVLII